MAALPPRPAWIVDGGHHSARKFADNWKETLSKARLLQTRKIAKTDEKMVDKLEPLCSSRGRLPSVWVH